MTAGLRGITGKLFVFGLLTVLVSLSLSGCTALAQIFGTDPSSASVLFKITIDGTTYSKSDMAFDFGLADEAVGTSVKVAVVNEGKSTLTIDKITFTNPTEFHLASGSTAPLSVDPGGAGEVEVVFKPSASGARTGSASFIAGNQLETINLTGLGNHAPEARFAVVVSGATSDPTVNGTYLWNPALDGGSGAYVYTNGSTLRYIHLYWDAAAVPPEASPYSEWLIDSAPTGHSSYIYYGRYASSDGTANAATVAPPEGAPKTGLSWTFSNDVGDPNLDVDTSNAGIVDNSGIALSCLYGDQLGVTGYQFFDRDGDAEDTTQPATYQWQIGDSRTGPFTDIAGATTPTLPTDVTQQGKWLRNLVTIHATAGIQSGTSTTQPVFVY